MCPDPVCERKELANKYLKLTSFDPLLRKYLVPRRLWNEPLDHHASANFSAYTMLAKSSNLAEIVKAEHGSYANHQISFSTEILVILYLVNPVILWDIKQIQVMCVEKRRPKHHNCPRSQYS